MTSFFRVIKFAVQDIARNLGLSFTTILVLVLMLLSVNLLWSVKIITKAGIGLVKDQVNMSIYLTGTATPAQLESIKKYVQYFPEVQDITVLSQDQVLQSFQERHRLNPEILAALTELGTNPFGPTMVVKTREPEDYQKIIAALHVPEYDPIIETTSYQGQEEALMRMQNITQRVEKISLGLSVFFLVISFLIIFNTIRIAISIQKTEIAIKRLVGANSWFIRGPYWVEAFIFTLCSLFVAGVIIYLALHWIDPYLSIIFPSGFALTDYYKSNILYVITIEAVAVFFLTGISAALAMRRQLKV